MTDDAMERARKVADRMIGYTGDDADRTHDADIIATAIREAEARERERCAQWHEQQCPELSGPRGV